LFETNDSFDGLSVDDDEVATADATSQSASVGPDAPPTFKANASAEVNQNLAKANELVLDATTKLIELNSRLDECQQKLAQCESNLQNALHRNHQLTSELGAAIDHGTALKSENETLAEALQTCNQERVAVGNNERLLMSDNGNLALTTLSSMKMRVNQLLDEVIAQLTK
jgi:chromosome segregation ATPase